MQIGFIGLGKMGSRMVKKLLKEGHEVVVWNRSQEPVDALVNSLTPQELQGISPAASIKELVAGLSTPKVIWLMLPAGEATESILEEVSQYVEKGDIVIDGGNAKHTDTQRRFDMFAAKDVRFLGIGVSGGIIAATEGYPLMVGGDKTAYEHITPILNALSKPNGGYSYVGIGGAGHFVKMVHNAIEYSYMQGIGEGFGVLAKSPYNLDLENVARLYTKNTLISGFMMDRTVEVLEKDPRLSHIAGIIGKASGETIWTVEEAKKQELPIENIEQALEFRNRSETDEKIQQSFAARMVAALRNAFGGHAITQK